jgi:signal transduction histidine kinase
MNLKLRHKIALTFSLVTAGIFLLLIAYIYIHSLQFERQAFSRKLHKRANLAIQMHLKQDELSKEIYARVRDEHLHSLMGEREFLLDLEGYSGDEILPDFLRHDFVTQVIEKGEHYEIDDDELSIVGIRVSDNQGEFIMFLAAENEVVRSNLLDLRNTLIGLMILYMLLVYAIGLTYAKYALRPLKSMAERMGRIDSFTLNERLPEPEADDEIRQLSTTFNHLMDRIDTAMKVQQNFISNASHELKNPLTAILGEIDVTMARDRTAEEYRETMKIVEHEANRLNHLTLRLLHLAETAYTDNTPVMRPTNLIAVMKELVADYDITHPSRKLKVQMPEGENAVVITGNDHLLGIAISNLIDNALKFSSDAVHLGVQQTTNTVTVTVSDTGIGIPEADIDNLFIPFFRSENARIVPGFGIGLPLVKRIIDMHEATLAVASGIGGTAFTIKFSVQVKNKFKESHSENNGR